MKKEIVRCVMGMTGVLFLSGCSAFSPDVHPQEVPEAGVVTVSGDVTEATTVPDAFATDGAVQAEAAQAEVTEAPEVTSEPEHSYEKEYPVFYYELERESINEAVTEVIKEDLAPEFEEADISIPYCNLGYIEYLENGNPLVWGYYSLMNYDAIEGSTTLQTLSGGTDLGRMEMTHDENGYIVTDYWKVDSGQGGENTMEAMCAGYPDALDYWLDSQWRSEAIRKGFLTLYICRNDLDFDSYQDYGWDPVYLFDPNEDGREGFDPVGTYTEVYSDAEETDMYGQPLEDPSCELTVTYNEQRGCYEVEVGIERLTVQDISIGMYKDKSLVFVEADAAGNPMVWQLTCDGEYYKLIVVTSAWSLLEEGTTFTFTK